MGFVPLRNKFYKDSHSKYFFIQAVDNISEEVFLVYLLLLHPHRPYCQDWLGIPSLHHLLPLTLVTLFLVPHRYLALIVGVVMETAGPVYIKLSQWASTRRDIFPGVVCDTLST